jgi:hypothetical protein
MFYFHFIPLGIIPISTITFRIKLMSSAFRYGKIVTGDHFIDRNVDIQRVQNNIRAGINTIFVSSRR